jgi:dTDP-4-amino-4,6-dideoxygalactose transaminase
MDRDSLQRVLMAENVLARRYFYPGAHRMEPYVSLPDAASHRLPVTERVAEEVLALPTGTAVNTADVNAICDLIRFCGDHASAMADWPAATSAVGPA